jgi:sterol desaturase/sphingolipid hydroxylase (fatty acid hydroxylase superfamily)
MVLRLAVFGPVVASALAAAFYAGGFRLLPIAAGALLWTILEYLMHRFAFHGFAPHGDHHAQPAEAEFLVAPLLLSLPMATAIFLLSWLATGSAVEAGLVIAGVSAGYLTYEFVHLRIHSRAAGGLLLRALRRYHYYHHFADDRVCYGVTTPLWDAVFASLPARDVIRRKSRERDQYYR